MKKILGYIVLLFCIIIYFISLNQKLTNELIATKLKSSSAFGSARQQYGDLYYFSFLSYFRRNHHIDYKSLEPPKCNSNGVINLYTVCDSYLWSYFDIKSYCNLNKLVVLKTNNEETLTTTLDTSKSNVLLIELAERNIGILLNDTVYSNHIINPSLSTSGGVIAEQTAPTHNLHRFLDTIERYKAILFNDKVNTNLESNIWDLFLFSPIKEFKADMNYKIFNSFSSDIMISDNGKQLFYRPTIDTTKKFYTISSFRHVSDKNIDDIVARLNNIYTMGKKMGFKKVYLSLIPNPVSILDPDYSGFTYNQLIQRIQSSPKLKMPFIDVFPIFNKMKGKVYQASDSHWSFYGANLWLEKFNAELNETAHQKVANAQ